MNEKNITPRLLTEDEHTAVHLYYGQVRDKLIALYQVAGKGTYELAADAMMADVPRDQVDVTLYSARQLMFLKAFCDVVMHGLGNLHGRLAPVPFVATTLTDAFNSYMMALSNASNGGMHVTGILTCDVNDTKDKPNKQGMYELQSLIKKLHETEEKYARADTNRPKPTLKIV